MYFSDDVLSGAKIATDDTIVEDCGQSTCYLKRIKNTTQMDTGMTRYCCVFDENVFVISVIKQYFFRAWCK